MDSTQKYTKAFVSAYDTHADTIFRLCYGKTGSREEAKDMTQETFVRVWQRLAKGGQEIENLPAFLFTVARNLIKDYYKKKKPILEHDLPEGVLERVPAAAVSFGAGAEYALALKALSHLPDDYRETVVLHLIEGLSISEVADVLGERPNTISVRLKRALEKLRAQMNISKL